MNTVNQLTKTIETAQPAPLSWPYTNLRGNQICMYGLDTSYWTFSITSKDKFQYEWSLIWSMQANRSTINNKNMITKIPKKNTRQITNRRNNNKLYNLKCSSRNQEQPKRKQQEWEVGSIKRSFENIKYGSYPGNTDLDDLLI